MQEGTQEKLKYFLTQGTWTSGHPDDLKRFYQFVAEAYRNNDKGLSSAEFFEIFKEISSDIKDLESYASRYYSKYAIGIEAIEAFDN